MHHLGVTLDEIPYEPRSWRPGEPLRVLITASFREKKGIPDAVRTLGRVQNEAELEVTIVGGATGEERSRAEERRILAAIEETGLGARVRLAGFLNGTICGGKRARARFLSPSITAWTATRRAAPPSHHRDGGERNGDCRTHQVTFRGLDGGRDIWRRRAMRRWPPA